MEQLISKVSAILYVCVAVCVCSTPAGVNLADFCSGADGSHYAEVNASAGQRYSFIVNETILPTTITCMVVLRTPSLIDRDVRHVVLYNSVDIRPAQSEASEMSTSGGNSSKCGDFLQVGVHEKRVCGRREGSADWLRGDQHQIVVTLYKATSWDNQQHVNLMIFVGIDNSIEACDGKLLQGRTGAIVSPGFPQIYNTEGNQTCGHSYNARGRKTLQFSIHYLGKSLPGRGAYQLADVVTTSGDAVPVTDSLEMSLTDGQNITLRIHGRDTQTMKTPFFILYKVLGCDPVDAPNNSDLAQPNISTSTVQCHQGYVVADSNLRDYEIHCDISSGMWETKPPPCGKIDCGPPTAPVGVALELTHNHTLVGAVVHVRCLGRQNDSQLASMVCGENGEWTPTFDSISNCMIDPDYDDLHKNSTEVDTIELPAHLIGLLATTVIILLGSLTLVIVGSVHSYSRRIEDEALPDTAVEKGKSDKSSEYADTAVGIEEQSLLAEGDDTIL